MDIGRQQGTLQILIYLHPRQAWGLVNRIIPASARIILGRVFLGAVRWGFFYKFKV